MMMSLIRLSLIEKNNDVEPIILGEDNGQLSY